MVFRLNLSAHWSNRNQAGTDVPSPEKGAAGLMQLMRDTAKKLNVHDRCDVKQNASGGSATWRG
jgi:membrane-bound lytic murein transglycosylase MltF